MFKIVSLADFGKFTNNDFFERDCKLSYFNL
jgi:hypothetical protein